MPFIRPTFGGCKIDKDGVESPNFVFTASPDDKWQVEEEGKYRLTFDLKAGETRRITLPFDRRLFGGYGRDGVYEPQRGEVSIWVDGCGGATPMPTRFGR